MCTAITYKKSNAYFGRNLDINHSYPCCVTVTPRNFPFRFHCVDDLDTHYAMIGMALNIDNYPLYFDATNEFGLSIAGLNFPGYAVYLSKKNNTFNIAPYELIPWLLGQCRSLRDARKLLSNTNLINCPFSEQYPLTPLHWLISDRAGSITLEPRSDGLHIYDNPVGVLTNSPPFDFHMQNLSNYRSLSCYETEDTFSENLNIPPQSQGTGAFGLPGDFSSASRFVRGTFIKCNSLCNDTDEENIGQFFHILDAVSQVRGCVRNKDLCEKTVYSSCCNTDNGVYYYTTYTNRQITGVSMLRTDLDESRLFEFPLRNKQQILMEN